MLLHAPPTLGLLVKGARRVYFNVSFFKSKGFPTASLAYPEGGGAPGRGPRVGPASGVSASAACVLRKARGSAVQAPYLGNSTGSGRLPRQNLTLKERRAVYDSL